MRKALTRRSRARLAIAVAALLAAWLLLVVLFVPAMIRAAHAGSAPEFLNRIIAGRSQHPVETYLALWYRTARILTAVLVGTLLAAALAFRFRIALRHLLHRLVAWLFPVGAAAAGPLDLLALGAASGAAFGFLEWLAFLLRRALSDWVGEYYSGDAIWMMPLGAGMVFVLLSGLAALLSVVLRSRDLRRFAVLVFVTLGVRGLLATGFGEMLHPGAAMLLSVGCAVQVARGVSPLTPRRRFTIRFAAAGLGLAVLLTGAGRTLATRLYERNILSRLPEAPTDVPDVLLIVLDVVRARDMSLYGYERPTTPFLEAWARGGVTFENAMAPAPWTLPSHAALFSGHLHRPRTWQSPVEWRGPTLAETLSGVGYATGGFVANLYYGTRYYGLQRGFAHYEAYPRDMNMVLQSPWVAREITQSLKRVLEPGPWEPLYKTAGDVNDDFLQWLDALDTGRPFFAFLNYIDAHAPYIPPAPFNQRFARPGALAHLGAQGHRYSRSEVEDLRASYDGSIAYIDSELQRLFGELERRGLTDDLLVVVTSDHGEEFLEHGVMGHSHSLYLPALRVPLVIRYPGRVAGGSRFSEPVALADLPATVADLLHLGPASPFPGRSLAQYWEADPAKTPPRVIYSETTAKAYGLPDWYPNSVGGIRSLFRDSWHYIRYDDGREELFDVSGDQFEQSNLAARPEARALIEELRLLLDASGPDTVATY